MQPSWSSPKTSGSSLGFGLFVFSEIFYPEENLPAIRPNFSLLDDSHSCFSRGTDGDFFAFPAGLM